MHIISLSGTPTNADCAQVGRDPEASHRSKIEALAYKAAMIAIHGRPPEGYKITVSPNHHDFGTYYTLDLSCPSETTKHCPDFEDRFEAGLDDWHDALMPAPFDYRDDGTIECISDISPADEAIERALIASRPDADGQFALDLFRTIHGNLREAYPQHAARADRRIAIVHQAAGVSVQ